MANPGFPPTLFKGYITGTVQASVAFTALPVETLEALLPEGAALAPQTLTPLGTHPVYWSFNFNQNDVGTPIPGLTLNYHEFALVITDVYVKKTGPNGPRYGYPVILYLNSWMGVLGGRVLWHLNKRHAPVKISDTNPYTRLLVPGHISGVFEQSGVAQPSENFPNFETVRPLLDQDLLSCSSSGALFGSKFIIDYNNLPLQPLQAEIMTDNFVPGLSEMNFSAPGIDQTPMGTFSFTQDWKLYTCKKL